MRRRTPPRELLPQLQGRLFAALNPLVPEILDDALAPLARLARRARRGR